MGELIRREVAPAPFAFTGERLTSAVSGQIEIEHYHRYLIARDHCRGRDILDVASGEGYGTALLAQVAQSAIGVELDAASVQAAAAGFARPNLSFLRGDARALPLADLCVDVVVSFETIEHFDGQASFLAEVRRVLRPGGLFIVSTPDREVYSAAGTPPNPFHVHELTRTEFEALLRTQFTQVVLAAQRPIIGSAIVAEITNGAPRIFDRRGATHIEACSELPRAPYMVAFASDVALPPPQCSIYVERSDLDTDLHVRVEADVGRERQENDLARLKNDFEAEQQSHRQQLQVECAKAEAAAEERDRRVAECAVLERTCEKAERAITLLRQHLAKSSEDVYRLEQEVPIREQRIALLEQEAPIREQRIALLEQEVAIREQRIALLEHEVPVREQRIALLEQEVPVREQRIALLEQKSALLKQKIARLRASISWRLTRPLRILTKAILRSHRRSSLP